MNRLGIQSLNAGAPDLRLSGDQTQRGTYVQRRRNQMAYGGTPGADGRKAYGIGSFFQEKIKDPIKEKFVDPAIDFVTENPLLTAGGIGLGINQFGLPGGAGQNWIGELLGGVTGKEGGYDTVLNPSTWFGGSQTGDLPGYTGVINPARPHADTPEVMRQQGIAEMLNYMNQQGSDSTVQKVLNAFGLGQGTGDIKPDASGRYPINWRGPLSIGSAIGAADYLTRSDDKMPPQLSVNIPQSGQEAFDDPNLRFKPKEQYVDTMAMAADGGRIGLANGGNRTFHEMLEDRSWKDFDEYEDETKYGRRYLDETDAIFEKFVKRFPGIDTTEMDINTMIAMLQAEGVVGTENLGIAGLDKSMGMITPESVTAAKAKIMQNMAKGGRIGYAGNGGGDVDPIAEIVGLMSKQAIEGLSPDEDARLDALIKATGFMTRNKAQGGRIGHALGKGVTPSKPKASSKEKLKIILENLKKGLPSLENIKKNIPSEILEGPGMQEGGLMNLGGMEKDYRQEGGFVPLGGEEKADDVPARLSKNEFVFTADAVRAAGGGDVDAGAEVMENLMENLEAGGKVSEESQGLEGARDMFANAQALEKRII